MTCIRACQKRLLVAALLLLALTSFSVPQVGFSYSVDAPGIAGEPPGRSAGPASSGPDRVTPERAREDFAKLPLCFELNRGQADPRVRFISRGDGFNLALTANQAILQLAATLAPEASRRRPRIRKPTSALLRMKLLGANPQPIIDRMAALGITQGCGGGNYCPTQAVTRGRMAVSLVSAFNL
jgi:hypothetical protein